MDGILEPGLLKNCVKIQMIYSTVTLAVILIKLQVIPETGR